MLNANEKLALRNLALQVGSVDQSVEVRAKALQLQAESGERSQTMNSNVMENIAINGWSYLPLVELAPGVTTAPNRQTAGHAGIGAISANGGRANQNNHVFNHTQFSGYNTTVNFIGLVNPTVTNLFLKSDGTINNLNGFGTVSGARDPRIRQLAMRFVF